MLKICLSDLSWYPESIFYPFLNGHNARNILLFSLSPSQAASLGVSPTDWFLGGRTQAGVP